MFIVVLKATPTPAASDFSSVAGALVTIFTCMITEDDAVEVANAFIGDALWSVTSIDSVFWLGEEQAKDDPDLFRSYEWARNEGPTCNYKYYDSSSEGGLLN
jgi:hypothetical protein